MTDTMTRAQAERIAVALERIATTLETLRIYEMNPYKGMTQTYPYPNTVPTVPTVQPWISLYPPNTGGTAVPQEPYTIYNGDTPNLGGCTNLQPEAEKADFGRTPQGGPGNSGCHRP